MNVTALGNDSALIGPRSDMKASAREPDSCTKECDADCDVTPRDFA